MTATYDCIATTTLSTTTSTVTFSSISSSFTDLLLVFSGTSTSSFTFLIARFNNDTGTNYSYTLLQGDGSSASSTRGSNTASPYVGLVNTGTGAVGVYKLQVMNYANTTTYKTLITNGGIASNRVQAGVMLWRSTAAINRIDLFPDGGDSFASGSTFSLYGIKAE